MVPPYTEQPNACSPRPPFLFLVVGERSLSLQKEGNYARLEEHIHNISRISVFNDTNSATKSVPTFKRWNRPIELNSED